MTEDRDIEVEHETSSFAAELRRLADALESGEAYTITLDGEDVTIPENARLAVAHEREDGETELEFQLSWSEREEGDEEEVDEIVDDIEEERDADEIKAS
jgi:amphi-Trp domain-containing protein